MSPDRRMGADPLDDLLDRFRREVDPADDAGAGLPDIRALGPRLERSGGEGRSEVVRNLRLRVKVELGRVVMPLREALELTHGQVLELGKDVGDPVTVLVSGVPVARGQVLVVDDRFCVRITEVLSGESERNVGEETTR